MNRDAKKLTKQELLELMQKPNEFITKCEELSGKKINLLRGILIAHVCNPLLS